MFPFLKDLASKYPVPKKDLAGGINISATDGETFVPQEMVDDVGLGNLEFFNNKPKEGGHQSIDSIIAFETLQNIKPVSNGGEIQLDNFMGGGPLMNYDNGGQVPQEGARRLPEGSVMDYIHGGLDVAGMVPVLGAIPDLINAGIYGGEALLAGDDPTREQALGLMALSGAAAVPMFGQAATAAKYVTKAGKKGVGKIQQSRLRKAAAERLEGAKYSPADKYGSRTVTYPAVKGSITKKGLPSYQANISRSGKEVPMTSPQPLPKALTDIFKSKFGLQHGGLTGMENGGQTPEMDIRRNTANLGPSPYMRYERSGGVPVQGDPLYDERRGYIDDFIKHTEQRADFMPFETREGFQKFVESGEGNMRDEMLLKRLLSSLHETGIHYDKGKADIDNLNFLAKQGYQLGADEISSPSRRLLDSYAKEMDILDNIKRTSSFFNKQHGGLTGMQDGGYDVQSLIESLVPTSVMDDPAPEHSHMRGYAPQPARENEELRPTGDLAFIHGGVSSPMKLSDGSYHKPPGLRRLAQEVSPYEESSGDLETTSWIKKLLGMQHGGPLPKGSTAEKTPNPFVPFDQRPNQDTASGRWGEPGAYMRSLAGAMDSLNMEDSIMTHKKGQNFLNKLRIKSMLNGEGIAIENPRPKYLYDGLNMRDTIQQGPTMRDLNEYFNSQLMQGRDSAAIEQGRQYRRPFPGY